jgi:hypothetical protein
MAAYIKELDEMSALNSANFASVLAEEVANLDAFIKTVTEGGTSKRGLEARISGAASDELVAERLMDRLRGQCLPVSKLVEACKKYKLVRSLQFLTSKGIIPREGTEIDLDEPMKEGDGYWKEESMRWKNECLEARKKLEAIEKELMETKEEVRKLREEVGEKRKADSELERKETKKAKQTDCAEKGALMSSIPKAYLQNELRPALYVNHEWTYIGLHFASKGFQMSLTQIKAQCGDYKPESVYCGFLLESLGNSDSVTIQDFLQVLCNPQIGMNAVASKMIKDLKLPYVERPYGKITAL